MMTKTLNIRIVNNEPILNYSLLSEQDINAFHLGLFLSNPHLPIVPMHLDYFDLEPQLHYKINGLITLNCFMSKTPTIESLLKLIYNLLNDVLNLRQYHLCTAYFNFDSEWCYIEPNTLKVKFIYLPDSLRESNQVTLKELIKSMLPVAMELVEVHQLKCLYRLMCFAYEDDSEMTTEDGLMEKVSILLQEWDFKTSPMQQSFNKHSEIEELNVFDHDNLILANSQNNHINDFEIRSNYDCQVQSKGITRALKQLFSFCHKTNESIKTIRNTSAQSNEMESAKLGSPFLKTQSQKECEDFPMETPPFREWDYADAQGVLKKQPVVERTQFQTVLLNSQQQFLKLLIRHASQQSVQEFNQEKLSIGRNESTCDIIFNDPSTGRLHAELFKREGQCYIKDLNSLNGTFVNQVRIVPNHFFELKQGDEIAIGRGSIIIL